jgi:uncharacterized protein YecT (DUF1311 family)
VKILSYRIAVVPFFILAAGAAQADASLECSLSAGSQVETGDCVAATEATVESVLEQVLGFARSAAEELDATTGRAVSVPALDASQAAWAAFRDAHCDYIGSTWGGGSGTGIAISSCRIDLGRDRIDALMDSLP